MLDETLAELALRARLLGTTVATTGSTSLAATTTGYTRSAGSFITDGFREGMEVSVTGFPTAANNGKGVILKPLTATVMLIDAYDVSSPNVVTSRTLVVEAEAAGRTISAGIPALRAFDNIALVPVTGKPYLEEVFSPATHRLITFPAAGAHAEDTGLYVVTWFGLSGTGIGIRKSISAIKARFTPGTNLPLSDGTTLTMPQDVGARAGAITPIAGGWGYVQITIPYRVFSLNTIAA